MIILALGIVVLTGLGNIWYYEYRYPKNQKVEIISLIGWKL